MEAVPWHLRRRRGSLSPFQEIAVTPPSTSVREPSLVPVTVWHASIPTDLALSSTVPLVELLPALAQRLSALDHQASSYGLHLVTQDGTVLDSSRSLGDQRVRPGAVLTLALRDTRAAPRYDDLVEAVATAVEEQQTAWEPRDSVAMSLAASCLLFLVVGVLLLRQGPGDPLVPLSAVVVTGLLVLAAYALDQLRIAGTWAVVMTAGALAGVAGHTALEGSATGLRLEAAGAAAAAAVALCAPTLRGSRPVLAGPALVCVALVGTGLGTQGLGYPLHHVLAVVTACAAVISLIAPWLALASVPVTVSLPDQAGRPPLRGPQDEVSPSLVARVMDMTGLVLSVRVSCSITVLTCVPVLMETGWEGAALVAAVAAAFMLSTRAVRSRSDVLAGVVGGMAVLVVALVVTVTSRTDLLMPAVGAVGAVGVAVLLLNVLGPSYRPRLARAADAVEVLVLMTIPPLAAVVGGVL
ncbi:hypothetical protein D5R93_00700 [Actinomyces lilanjuaniae]|uniref:EccD-like transmembrane domain-containing protein n=1 Tax=Actinomyces lilanjuaniae TaxID=2321394 RepID=A0ABN5PL58_9ACTO|nr:hypothetical protein D5R93_00700 [Actinomyces lilanjuaniae]